MHGWILTISPTIKLGVALVGIVSLMRGRVPMGAALLVGALLLALFFPMPWSVAAEAAVLGLIDDQAIFLLLIVVGLLVFSAALNETGQIQRIIESFQALVGTSRMGLVAFPALIGLLPMPGGAIFSAPMVKASVEEADLSPARVMAANYWFRHVWEYWFPLYPGVITALTLTKMPTAKYILVQFPMTLWSLAWGYAIILHSIRLDKVRRRDYSGAGLARFLRELSPILIVVVAVIALSPLADAATRLLASENMVLRHSAILAAVTLAMAWLFRRRGLTWRTLGRIFFRRQILDMAFLVFGLMVFKSIQDACGATAALRDELTGKNVPFVLVVALLPFATGLVIGVAVGFVGASFPLVIALVAAVPETERLAYYFLAYVMGYVGMMLSPVHLCLVITNEYFKSRLLRVYAFLIPLSLSVVVFGGGLFALYLWILR
ncbi:MAG TPA: DUF401 family protein [Sumerlaeia bacterium]|nr:DUF401 family protein [Sumerlaeia bacterium]